MSHNYMDDVPVKISERYKPPPRIYQLPVAIANKLALPEQHYHESPHYAYDFQLERKVLSKIPEWRRMREQETLARRERQAHREQQRLREEEQKHKHMLGAVNYPSTEELSSSSESEATPIPAVEENTVQTTDVSAAVVSNFHNILQPTVLTQDASSVAMQKHSSMTSSSPFQWKCANAFNYKDFEMDNSSPFDNAELKSMNDLDVLAQVLNITHLRAKQEEEEKQAADESANSNTITTKDKAMQNAAEMLSLQQIGSVDLTDEPPANCDENGVNNTNVGSETTNSSSSLTKVSLTNKVDLKSVDYNYCDFPEKPSANIPTASQSVVVAPLSVVYPQQPHPHQQLPQFTQLYSTTYPYMPPYSSGITQHHNNMLSPQSVQMSNGYAASYAASNHNSSVPNNASTPTMMLHSVHHNAYALNTMSQQQMPLVNAHLLNTAQLLINESDMAAKSKSVPDILKELSEEVRNSEIRRNRNHSYNLNNEQSNNSSEHQQNDSKLLALPNSQQTSATPSKYFDALEASQQQLVKNISSMGFPLERVSKLSQMFNGDDKKIFEHLIPLSELIDLGFEEAKISEALVKFGNSKEKALDYLIS